MLAIDCVHQLINALFQDDGNMRYLKAQSILNSELAVETSSGCQQEPHALVFDESAVFWEIK